jgi:hypothetical protein
VVFYVIRALGEEDVGLTRAIAHEDKHGRGRRLRVVHVARIVIAERLLHSFEEIFVTHCS